MELSHYQKEALKTDQATDNHDRSLMISLLGLTGEAGSLLTEFKKHLRDGKAYYLFTEKITEELGDVLWYIANIASRQNLDLSQIAKKNLEKTQARWLSQEEIIGPITLHERLFDEKFSKKEQLPRHFRVEIREVKVDGANKVFVTWDEGQFGDKLTDNSYEDDGYRFHDVFHLAYAVILGWSPICRRFFGRKRKSHTQIDEVEDGGRAAVIDEAISALVFDHAKSYSFYDGANTVTYELLRTIKDITERLEVRRCSMHEWEHAILEGFRVWRKVKDNKGGVIVGNLISRTIEYIPSEPANTPLAL